jgi:hypothetical protein
MENPTKRQRTEGTFTPLHSSAAGSTASPTTDDVIASVKEPALDLRNPPTLTPMSDMKPLRQPDSEDDDSEDEEEEDSDPEDQAPSAAIEDVEMGDGDKDTQPVDWHLREPTARPEYISQHLNKRIPNYYKVCSTR